MGRALQAAEVLAPTGAGGGAEGSEEEEVGCPSRSVRQRDSASRPAMPITGAAIGPGAAPLGGGGVFDGESGGWRGALESVGVASSDANGGL